MLNTIVLMGRLTRDPELVQTANDNMIGNFTLAIDNPNLDKNGDRGSTFLDVKCFGKAAEAVSQHTRKGSKVAVSGSITSRSYIAKDGGKRIVFEIIANSVEFLDPKQKEEPSDPEDGELDSAGSLDGETIEVSEETGEPKKLKIRLDRPKFDPMTGKPLKQKAGR